MKKFTTNLLKKFLENNKDMCLTSQSPDSVLNSYILFFRNKFGVLNPVKIAIQLHRSLNVFFQIFLLKKKKSIAFIGYPKMLKSLLTSYANKLDIALLEPKDCKKLKLKKKDFFIKNKLLAELNLIVIYDLVECENILPDVISLGIPIIYFTSGNSKHVKTFFNLRNGFHYPVFINNYSHHFIALFYVKFLEKLLGYRRLKR